MILYVLRHAEAVVASDDLPDEWRYLTEDGVKSQVKMAQKMADYCKMPRLIVSSPLVRAVQTAQIVATYAGRKCKVIADGLLQAGSDLGAIQDLLRTHAKAKRIMVVGHEPHLGLFVTALLQKNDTIQLKKSGCVALEIDTDQPEKPAKFLFYMKPGGKTVTSFKTALHSNDHPAPQ